MKALRDLHDKVAPNFEHGGKFEKLHPLWEAHDTLLFTPGLVTRAASHIRDALDQKRMMIMVVVALLPCFLMAMFNTGYQANAAIAAGAAPLAVCGWGRHLRRRSRFPGGAGAPPPAARDHHLDGQGSL